MHIYVLMYIHIYMYMYIPMYIHIYIRICTHTCMYIYIYIYICTHKNMERRLHVLGDESWVRLRPQAAAFCPGVACNSYSQTH